MASLISTLGMQRTENLMLKFTGPLSHSILWPRRPTLQHLYVASHPLQIMVAMSKHTSQFVW